MDIRSLIQKCYPAFNFCYPSGLYMGKERKKERKRKKKGISESGKVVV
jgi:hypothetical protein